MPHVFVSHASQDHDVVFPRIVQLLNEHGLTTFYSRDSILGAQEWEKRIREGLEDCPWFLVALSPNSVASEWVQAEVGWALVNRRGRLVPVLVGDCRPEDCNLRLCQIQYVDLRANHPDARRGLINILQSSALETESVADSQRPERHGAGPSVEIGAPPATDYRNWVWAAVAGTALTAAAGAWWWPRPESRPESGSSAAPQVVGPTTPDPGNSAPAASPATSSTPATSATPSGSAVTLALGLDQDVRLPDPAAINAEGHAEVDPFAVQYEYATRDDALVVRYTMPYLESIRRGERVRGVEPRPFSWYFPKLSVKTLNNSSRTVLLTECVLEVTASSVIQDPLITVADGSFNSLIFLNDGWGPVQDPVVTFSFGSGTSGNSAEVDGSSADGDGSSAVVERHTLELKTFDDVSRIPIARYLPDQLDGAAAVDVSGVLEYGPSEARQSLKFITTVSLESHSGDPSPPTREYDVMLVAGDAPKTIRRPIAQEIKSAESDQFLLRVGSDKSGRYQINVKFVGVDGQVVAERKLELEIFVPRMASKHVKPAAESAGDKPSAP